MSSSAGRWRAGRCLAGAAAAWLAATCAQAQEEGYAPLLKYMQNRGPSGQQDPWVLVWIGVAIAALAFLYRLYLRRSQRPAREAAAQEQQPKPLNFGQRAAALGFKVGEARVLRRITQRLSPHTPDTLLATTSGRDYLAADLDRRIRQRRREIEILRRIQEKLRTGSHPLYERESERVPIDMHVWITRKVGHPQQGEPEKEDVFVDSQPVPGRLLDLSEGGAAVRAHLTVAQGDWVECWSLDSQVWTKPVTANVLQVEERRIGDPPVLHLRFVDPPLEELRELIQQAQVEHARRGGRVG